MDQPGNPAEPARVEISVDRDSEIPIGVQLTWALRSRIGDGTLAAGQRLPGLRELADAVDVNINTVRAVYQRLDHEGLIDSQQGSGTYVTAEPLRRSEVSTIAANAAQDARELGVDPREVAAALYVAPTSPPTTAATSAQRRRALRTQISALEMALGEIEAEHPELLPPPGQSETRPDLGPRLLDADGLAHVRQQQLKRLAKLQQAADELGRAGGQADTGPRTGVGDRVSSRSKRTKTAPATPRAAPANG